MIRTYEFISRRSLGFQSSVSWDKAGQLDPFAIASPTHTLVTTIDKIAIIGPRDDKLGESTIVLQESH